MAWTAPMTAVAGAFNAADFNTYVRDNLNTLAPALATAVGQYFVATGANALVARSMSTASVSATQTTTSASYTDLSTVGPAVTVTSGTRVLVMFSAVIQNATANAGSRMSVAVSGASTVAASDSIALIVDGQAASNSASLSVATLFTGLTAGSNTFTAKYMASSGTGSFGTRRIVAVPF